MTAETDTLERGLESDRNELRETLTALEEKMSPGRLVDEAMAYFNTGPREFVTQLAAEAKSNPMPVLLTGVGLAWLIAGGRPSQPDTSTERASSAGATSGMSADDYEAWTTHDRVAQFELDCSRTPDEPHDDWQTRLHAARASALELDRGSNEDEGSFRARVEAAAEAVRSKGTAARNRIRETLVGARDSATQTIHDGGEALRGLADGVKAQGGSATKAVLALHQSNPLVTGALGVALGALLGSLLPQGEQEDQALGDLADKGLGSVAAGAEALARAVSDKLPSSGTG